LYAGLVDKFDRSIRDLMSEHNIAISPVVRLELQFLYEIHRIAVDANTIVSDLANRIGLTIDDKNFNATINRALDIPWTRDPFDRLIVAIASLEDSILASKDLRILNNYPFARW
jgi:PIN domain nuclease of toxin-antitoxin system